MKKKKIECHKCKTQSKCCSFGAWVDLEEAKKILALGIKGGDFFHLEGDDICPSGYRVGTSYENEPCSFITREGLCAIHKIDYNLKPAFCKEFPYENGKLSSFAKHLCVIVKARHKQKSRRASK
ncbi:MAG: YkgJ family cysteine cluster protein [Candidatus Omnitrophica bacterium]|nr:YkgJ family cysteine cluster protein [Candidatus Omnitrophota bacterium]